MVFNSSFSNIYLPTPTPPRLMLKGKGCVYYSVILVSGPESDTEKALNTYMLNELIK